ncbi:MAG TPA: guanylate kinase [Desulfobacteraceae bacterium]|nr:guanylate kinase [Desulfobacteraceae bacterium]
MSGGILFVVSAPSGGGKTTILKKVMAELPGLVFSVSCTTRAPRAGEQDGRDYHFISREAFTEIRSRRPSGFLEWAEVHGNLYGTGREQVERLLGAGMDVVLDIDVQGAMQVQKTSAPVLIFIAPPSPVELEARLRKRGTETGSALALRLENARREMQFMDQYDYLIINDRLAEAVDCLRSIVVAERCRRRRSPAGLPVRTEF